MRNGEKIKKRIITLAACILIAITLVACDHTNNEEKIINVFCDTGYINTTETWTVNSHNGYKAIYTNKEYDDETDTYTVTIKFSKLLD